MAIGGVAPAAGVEYDNNSKVTAEEVEAFMRRCEAAQSRSRGTPP